MQVSSVLESCFTVVCVSKIVWLFLLRSCQCWLKPSHSVTSADLCGRCSCLTGLSVVACCLVLVTPWGQGSHLRGFMVMHVSHKASCCLDALKRVWMRKQHDKETVFTIQRWLHDPEAGWDWGRLSDGVNSVSPKKQYLKQRWGWSKKIINCLVKKLMLEKLCGEGQKIISLFSSFYLFSSPLLSLCFICTQWHWLLFCCDRMGKSLQI